MQYYPIKRADPKPGERDRIARKVGAKFSVSRTDGGKSANEDAEFIGRMNNYDVQLKLARLLQQRHEEMVLMGRA